MASAFDGRLFNLTVQLPGGAFSFNQDFTIQASGRKYWGAIQGECQIRIFNLTRQMQNNILTQASPMIRPGVARTPINISLDVGRQSYGLFNLFSGYAFQCGMTQPPDIGITFRALANNLQLSLATATAFPQSTTLFQIAQNFAKQNGWTLNFQSTQGAKLINNFQVSGSGQQQLDHLAQAGNVDVALNGTVLNVLDLNQTVGNSILISQNTGMVGIPQVTDIGVLVRTMVIPSIQVGGGVTVQSNLNPAANGKYKVMQHNFEVASREPPFWYDLSCLNPGFTAGVAG